MARFIGLIVKTGAAVKKRCVVKVDDPDKKTIGDVVCNNVVESESLANVQMYRYDPNKTVAGSAPPIEADMDS